MFTDGSGCDQRRTKDAGWGFVAVAGCGAVVLHRDCGRCEGEGLAAEICAVVEALRWLSGRPAYIWCDCQAVRLHVDGFACKAPVDWSELDRALACSPQSKILGPWREPDSKRFHAMAHNLATQGRKGGREHYLRALDKRFCDDYGRYKPRQIWRASLRSPLVIPTAEALQT